VQLEAQKTLFDQRQQQARQQPQPQMTVDDVLANMLSLYGSEIDWIRKNPHVVMDRATNNRLVVYFDEAVAKGIPRGSPEFQRYLEDRLGINSDTRTSSGRDDPEQRYAAPVSRTGSGLDLDPSELRGKVTLSPAQIDAARMAGISLELSGTGSTPPCDTFGVPVGRQPTHQPCNTSVLSGCQVALGFMACARCKYPGLDIARLNRRFGIQIITSSRRPAPACRIGCQRELEASP
jgi:hypothetical protein